MADENMQEKEDRGDNKGELIVKKEKSVKDWNIDDVFNWAKLIVAEKHAQKLKDEEVKGSALLNLTEDKFRLIGIPLGPASDLATAINKLKSPSPTGDYQTLQRAYSDLYFKFFDLVHEKCGQI